MTKTYEANWLARLSKLSEIMERREKFLNRRWEKNRGNWIFYRNFVCENKLTLKYFGGWFLGIITSLVVLVRIRIRHFSCLQKTQEVFRTCQLQNCDVIINKSTLVVSFQLTVFYISLFSNQWGTRARGGGGEEEGCSGGGKGLGWAKMAPSRFKKGCRIKNGSPSRSNSLDPLCIFSLRTTWERYFIATDWSSWLAFMALTCFLFDYWAWTRPPQPP